MKEARESLIAAACHSSWYAYTVLALGEEGEPWATAPEWQKESIRNAVDFWDRTLAEIIGNEDPMGLNDLDLLRKTLPEKSHQNWMEHKAADGWVYGPIKDPEKKTHHCMVPYGDLPEDQRKKDLVVIETYLALRLEGF